MDARVYVWSSLTGKKTLQIESGGEVEVTAMSFDKTGRRLVTGKVFQPQSLSFLTARVSKSNVFYNVK